MRLLLDTHAFLWWSIDDDRLGAAARSALANPDSLVFVSAASVWEIAIKVTLGKLDFEADPAEEIVANRFAELPITALHAQEAGRLPRHHDDPFDRMLIAQARLEGLTLVSRDGAFAEYEVPLLRS